MIPSSFCTLSNYNSHQELFGLLLSLSIFHPYAKVYIGSDQKNERFNKQLFTKIKIKYTMGNNFGKIWE